MFSDVTDANEATKPGFYQSSIWADNTPVSSGILIMPYYYTGYWKFQLFCNNVSTHLWFRSGTSVGYNSWKQIV